MRSTKGKKIVGASIGDCVHVAGVLNFLRLAEGLGYETVFLGAARSPEDVASLARNERADILAVGYRLDPEAARKLFRRLKGSLAEQAFSPSLFFGGTPPVAAVAVEECIFDAVFSGKEGIDEIISFLRGAESRRGQATYPDTLVERIGWKDPYPLLRHHFGLPSVHDTEEGIARIADAGVVDVISLGPDQNAQAHFFRPLEMDKDQDGAGGVPVRSPRDFERLYRASRRGNHPLMRCYSGTCDVISFAEVLRETICNAWAAIPLCWYNVLDRRGPREVAQSIREGQTAMAWHAERGIPVEVNEAHQWSLRDAPDVVAVAASYLGGYTAKKMGVRDYVAQFMFNTPPGTSATMDLGKMLAKIDLLESLQDDSFRVWRQVRAGLASFPVDLGQAKGQLAASTLVSMSLRPHIVHVVGFCEGDHIAGAVEVIESCQIARGVIRNCLSGMPDMRLDSAVQARREELVEEAWTLLDAIGQLHVMRATGRLLAGGLAPGEADDPGEDPFTDPVTLAMAIKTGLLDAPHLRGNPHACGRIETAMVGGACLAIDPDTRKPLAEEARTGRILGYPQAGHNVAAALQ